MIRNNFFLVFFCLLFNKVYSQEMKNLDISASMNIITPINNYIENSQNLKFLSEYINSDSDTIQVYNILHIGDSHVKAGYCTKNFTKLLDSFLWKYHKQRGKMFSDTIAVYTKILAQNGATIQKILENEYSDSLILAFKPNLVIISFGTNESYNKMKLESFERYLNELISRIQNVGSKVDFLITSPAESMKKEIIKIKGKHHGKYNYLTNYYSYPEMSATASFLKTYARQQQLAFWNFYECLGGETSASLLFKKGYMRPDHVHLTKEAYIYQAQWLFEAYKLVIDSLILTK